jgi:hypothetical protein
VAPSTNSDNVKKRAAPFNRLASFRKGIEQKEKVFINLLGTISMDISELASRWGGRYDIQHNNIPHNDIQDKGLICITA